MTVFINFDVETTGPSPVRGRLLSIGAVADVDVNNDLTELKRLGEFSVNIETPEFGEPCWDPNTMKFWAQNEEALLLTLENPKPASAAITSFLDWIDEMNVLAQKEYTTQALTSIQEHQRPGGTICFVAYPIVFDMSWLRHYAFTHEHERFDALGWGSFSGVDLMTMMSMIRQEVPYRTGGVNWNKEWSAVMAPHYTPKHVALNDARAQAELFYHLLLASREIHQSYVFNLVRTGQFSPPLEPATATITITEEESDE